METNKGKNATDQSALNIDESSKETFSGQSALMDTEDLISGHDDIPDLSNVNGHLSAYNGRVSRQEYKRKQLIHDLQLLRIELSQKNLVVDNLKAEHMRKTDELEERLNDALHSKQLLHARLESALAIQQDEARSRQQQTQKELGIILERQQELETVNKKLQAKTADIQYQLQRDVQISEEEYIELKTLTPEQLSLKQFFSLRIYEELRPIQTECVNLREQRDKLSIEIAHLSHKLQTTQQNLVQECQKRAHAETQLKVSTAECEQSQNLLQVCNTKAQRFDSVKLEREKCETELLDLRKKHSFQQAELIALQRETDLVKEENENHLTNLKILQQDKDYLQKQLNDTTIKLENSSEMLQRIQVQLENTKQAREELYERYVSSRDENRSEYERKLQTELDRLRLQTNAEMDRLKSETHESYKSEIRRLKESVNLSNHERNQVIKIKDAAENRCEEYLGKIREIECSVDVRISDFQNEARTKSFELDRLQVVYEETHKNFVKASEECDRLSKKLEVISLDYSEVEKRSAINETELKSSLREMEARLSSYEKMETELDDVVMQAAEVQENDDEAERVLFSYGYGANIPTNAKLRMRQSIHLARRILKLEKLNTSLHSEIQQKNQELSDLKRKFDNSASLLNQCKQPYSYLIEGMQQRDAELDSVKKSLSKMEADYDELKKENKKLVEVRRKISADLERLLGHRQEMAVMRQVIQGLSLQGSSLGHQITSSRKTSSNAQASKPRSSDIPSSNHPPPVLFTKSHASQD